MTRNINFVTFSGSYSFLIWSPNLLVEIGFSPPRKFSRWFFLSLPFKSVAFSKPVLRTNRHLPLRTNSQTAVNVTCLPMAKTCLVEMSYIISVNCFFSKKLTFEIFYYCLFSIILFVNWINAMWHAFDRTMSAHVTPILRLFSYSGSFDC